MAVLTQAQTQPFQGVRPLDPWRDLGGIADLIEAAFGRDMDVLGQGALNELRWLSRFKPLLWWTLLFNLEGSDFFTGFVWEEDKNVVGNVTLSPMGPHSRRWLVSNVAVSTPYRGRGIAKQLLMACITAAQQQNITYLLLQVRADNLPARHIYESLKFQEIYGMAYFRLPQVRPVTIEPLPLTLSLRRRRFTSSETHQLHRLATAATPEPIQTDWPLRHYQFEISAEERLRNFLWGLVSVPSAYWVVVDGQKVIGSVQACPGRFDEASSIELLVHPKWRGQLEKPLLTLALNHLQSHAHKPVVAKHPTYHLEAINAYGQYGFLEEQTLCWMKRALP